jgi:hypothetical protein
MIMITAARFVVLIAVIGGIVLTAIALGGPDPWRLGALAIYTMAVVVPVVWMTARH